MRNFEVHQLVHEWVFQVDTSPEGQKVYLWTFSSQSPLSNRKSSAKVGRTEKVCQQGNPSNLTP